MRIHRNHGLKQRIFYKSKHNFSYWRKQADTNINKIGAKIGRCRNLKTGVLRNFRRPKREYPPLPFFQPKFRLIQKSEFFGKRKIRTSKYDKKTLSYTKEIRASPHFSSQREQSERRTATYMRHSLSASCPNTCRRKSLTIRITWFICS